jgi:uncharacterized membrane protein YeaQ/YmgE (transglycosylase-associated protein family)
MFLLGRILRDARKGAWIILGLIAGVVANSRVNRNGDGVIPDIVIGVIGALFGGWLMAMLAGGDMHGFNPYSMLVAILGGAVLLAVTYAVR